MNFQKIVKDTSISLSVTIFIFFFLELFITYFLGYRNIISGNKNCKLFNKEKNFSVYKPNCKLVNKNWENDITVEYFFNSFGRRDGKLNSMDPKAIKIASLGDSFTFGAMVPIDENYNYYGFKRISDKKYLIHNYGVGGENLDNVLNKIVFKEKVLLNYDFILYGLTPNDFFHYLEAPKSNVIETKNIKSKKPFYIINYKNIKRKILSLSISKFALRKILSNDSNYYSIYLKKKPYSGYLNSNLDENWNEAINKFELKISNLPEKIKSKLKIIILPQRAEVVGYRLGSYKGSFSNNLMKSCKKIKVDCFIPSLDKLSKINESHFIVDGHLTIEGNRSVGIDLANWSKSWEIKKKKK